jgi:hypothetical protein
VIATDDNCDEWRMQQTTIAMNGDCNKRQLWWTTIITDDNCNEWQLWWMTITTDGNCDERRLHQWRTTMDGNCADDNATERFVSANFTTMAWRKKNFLLRVFFFILLFFFQSCYKSYSLHDCKLKNTQECTTQMLIWKPMYKENKCMWGCITWCKFCITIKPCVCVCVCVCAPKT